MYVDAIAKVNNAIFIADTVTKRLWQRGNEAVTLQQKLSHH